MHNNRLPMFLVACLATTAVVSPAIAQVDPANRADAVVVDRDDDEGFDNWGLLGLLGLAGLLGRKRREDVHVVAHTDRNVPMR
ncbi:MAG TPA: WGxxGxxG family protein [Vicinamibacterales bacterium]|nr:WGxxGxxG family protein [Vicinamibacterales bacterium]